MKKIIILTTLAFGLIITQSCNSKPFKKIKAENKEDSASYMIGISVGYTLKMQEIPGINADLIVKGIREVLENDSALSVQEANMFLTMYFNELREKQANENLKKGNDFLAENRNKPGVIETESGLQYKVITEGTGKTPTENDRVKCHYRGKLLNGEQFDSSYDRGEPAQFALRGVIRGWTEGLLLMKEGGKYELYVPSALAYGPRGQQTIGPNETLIFEIELLEVIPVPQNE